MKLLVYKTSAQHYLMGNNITCYWRHFSLKNKSSLENIPKSLYRLWLHPGNYDLAATPLFPAQAKCPNPGLAGAERPGPFPTWDPHPAHRGQPSSFQGASKRALASGSP